MFVTLLLGYDTCKRLKLLYIVIYRRSRDVQITYFSHISITQFLALVLCILKSQFSGLYTIT